MIVVFWDDPIGSLMVILLGMIPAFLPLVPAMGVAFWANRRVERARSLAFAPGRRLPEDAEALARTLIPDATRVVVGGGAFADFFDPARGELRLSPEIATGRSPWAMAVAARESGHALGRGRVARLSRLRAPIVFLASLAAGVGWLAIVAGLVFLYPGLCARGAWMELLAVAALACTLPLEHWAVRRATSALSESGIELGEAPEAGDALGASTLARVASCWPGPLPLHRRKVFLTKRFRG